MAPKRSKAPESPVHVTPPEVLAMFDDSYVPPPEVSESRKEWMRWYKRMRCEEAQRQQKETPHERQDRIAREEAPRREREVKKLERALQERRARRLAQKPELLRKKIRRKLKPGELPRKQRFLRAYLENAVNKEKMARSKTGKVRKRITAAAEVCCYKACYRWSSREIQLLAERQDKVFDLRALLLVVDEIAALSLRENGYLSDAAQKVLSELQPFLGSWIALYFEKERLWMGQKQMKSLIHKWLLMDFFPTAESQLEMLSLYHKEFTPTADQAARVPDLTINPMSKEEEAKLKSKQQRAARKAADMRAAKKATQARAKAAKAQDLVIDGLEGSDAKDKETGFVPTEEKDLEGERALEVKKKRKKKTTPGEKLTAAQQRSLEKKAAIGEAKEKRQLAGVVFTPLETKGDSKKRKKVSKGEEGSKAEKQQKEQTVWEYLGPAVPSKVQTDSKSAAEKRCKRFNQVKTTVTKDGSFVESWPTCGDGRCLFRSLLRAWMDPQNVIPRDLEGRALSPNIRKQEKMTADTILNQLCDKLLENEAEVSALWDEEVADAVKRLRKLDLWPDAVCLSYLPDLIQHNITIVCINTTLGSLFSETHTVKGTDSANVGNLVIVYNGENHYELVTQPWYQMYGKRFVEKKLPPLLRDAGTMDEARSSEAKRKRDAEKKREEDAMVAKKEKRNVKGGNDAREEKRKGTNKRRVIDSDDE